jgi:outer membrane protein assembly factor BamB
MYGHDPAHTFAQRSSCAPAGPQAALRLVPKWFVHAQDSITSSPSIVDGIVYVGSWDGTFYAIDASSGTVLWQFMVDDQHPTTYGKIVSSAAVDDVRIVGAGTRKVVLFGGGATLYALAAGRKGPTLLAKIDLDPRTAALRARQKAHPPVVEIESSPAVGHFRDADRVFIGIDVHNNEGVGRAGVIALALEKSARGKTPMRFKFLFKFDPESRAVLPSLTAGSGRGFGCGGVWSSPVVDPRARAGRGVVVFGTANCDFPEKSLKYGEAAREGIFAIDGMSGRELWEYHPRGPQNLDDDFGGSPNLLGRGVVGEGSKDGWYYARDLVTGKKAWSTRVGQSGHINQGFAVGGLEATPAVGAVRGKPAIFATMALPTPLKDPFDSPTGPSIDSSLAQDPGRLSSLAAIDAATGKILWRSPLTVPTYGAPTYGNGVVYVPDTFGLQLQVIDADTGLLLRSIPLPGAPASAPAIVGNSIYLGVGVRETDLEWKAFGAQVQNAFKGTLGAHPLSPLSGVLALTVRV